MKILLSWLIQYVNVELTPGQIAKTLTNAGLEVDSVDKTTLGFEGVVVARIVDVQKHPEADKLCIATATDGEQTYTIVCGAPNCRTGIKTALALVGGNLTDEEGKRFKIKKSKLRGVESFGMLCSATELGIPGDGDGIVEFSEHVKEGTDVAELYGDTIFEISLTPNLGHCQSVIGVAREIAAATGVKTSIPEAHFEESDEPIEKDISLTVSNKEACPRYVCRLIKGVTVGSSPDWLKSRLEASGIRSINNLVDITNYVLLETGHPLHAFDYGRLEGKDIVVRNANKGESFVTLDEKTRQLDERDLLICDKVKPIALAGVMGGNNSEVTDTTKDVLLEAAYFSPSVIRKTSKRLGLLTDASRRFERGTDPNGLIYAINRATMLIQQIAGGNVCKGLIDESIKEFVPKCIKFRLNRANSLLGTQLSVGEVEDIFRRLEFQTKWDGSDEFSVAVPTYRNDLQEEIDLVEEVARIYGYDNIKKTYTRFTSTPLPHAPIFILERQVRSRLVAEGLQEFLTCDLIGPSLLKVVQEGEPSDDSLVKVMNPTSVEQSILRTSLLPGLLQVVKYNFDHQNQQIAGFEVGRIHFKEGEHYKEQSVAAIMLSGKYQPLQWDVKARDADFYDLKGVIENVLHELQVSDVTFKKSEFLSFHKERQASVYAGDKKIGMLGEVHPAIARRLDVPQRLLFGELNLHDLFKKRELKTIAKDLALFPGSERDWTLTLPETLPIAEVYQAIESARSRLLESASLVGVYRSDKLGKGLKNVTFNFLYRDLKKTISQETVEAEHGRIVAIVSKCDEEWKSKYNPLIVG